MCKTDTLFITCHICGKELAHQKVDHNQILTAEAAIRMHESMIRHLRTRHSNG